jgi:hypothetical protein
VVVDVFCEHDCFRPKTPFPGCDDLQLLAFRPVGGVEAHTDEPFMRFLDVAILRQEEVAFGFLDLCEQKVSFRFSRRSGQSSLGPGLSVGRGLAGLFFGSLACHFRPVGVTVACQVGPLPVISTRPRRSRARAMILCS